MIRLPLRSVACTLTVVAMMAAGCVSETKRVDGNQKLSADGVPPQVLRVPQQLQDLSGHLLRYHAKHQSLPDSLAVLAEDGLISAEQSTAMPDYAYHPRGLGVLPGGRLVMLVDAEVRIEGHAWCIVREPNVKPRSIQLNVTPISLAELEAAARRSP